MITIELNRLISKKVEIKYLDNGLKSLLSRIKVILKSSKNIIHRHQQPQSEAHSEIVQNQNQLRAPPYFFLPLTKEPVPIDRIGVNLSCKLKFLLCK